ncbi:hypothetical protein SLE2022_071990 [Rubroshorea leprosula]
MSFLVPEKKFSRPKKVLKHLASKLQSKLLYLQKSIKPSNTKTISKSISRDQRTLAPVYNHHAMIDRAILPVRVDSDDSSSHDHQKHYSGIENECVEDDSDNDSFDRKSLQLYGVDARAEEYISRGKEFWRLEKQKSVEEFWDRLARST